MSNAPPRTFTEDFRRFFLRGLVVILPSVLTLWIVVYAYQFVDDAIAQPINRGARVAVVESTRIWPSVGEWLDEIVADQGVTDAEVTNGRQLTEERKTFLLRRTALKSWWEARWYLNLIGLLIAIIAVYIAGRLLGGFVGRSVYRRLERMLTSIPFVKQVYPYVKQVVDFLFSDEQPMKFNRVIVCQYPRKGIWSIGFLTGDSMKAIREESGSSVSVFIPSSPTPFTGYTITVPLADIREVPITVEEAIRFSVSGGVLVPPHQAVASAEQSGLIPITPVSSPDASSSNDESDADTMSGG